MARSPDIDRGWAYVVIAGYFFFRFLGLGISFSPAILYSTFLVEFEESPVLTAWAVNLNTFVIYVSGEIANVLIRRIGFRKTITIGCLLSSGGLLMTSFATSIQLVFVSHGVITGIGYSMIYIATVPVVAQYFVKYRRIVFIISSSGLAIGQFVLPPLFEVLAEEFAWRGALFLFCGMNLNFFVVAAAFMPPRLVEDPVAEFAEDGEAAELQEAEAELQSLHEPTRRNSDTRVPRKTNKIISHLKIFCYPRFSLYFISNIAIGVAVSGIMTHLKTFALLQGHTEAHATFFLSLVGLFSIIGAIVIGVSLLHPKVNVLYQQLSFFLLLGVSVGFFGFVRSFGGFFVMASTVGFSMGILSAFPEVVIAIVGMRNLTTGMSFASVAIGIGVLSGGSFAAFLYELDPSYMASFVVTGAICASGSLLNVPTILHCAKCETKPEEL